MSALIKLILFFIAAFGLPLLSGLLPASLLPAGKRRFPVLLMSGYLSTFALFELVGLPILIWTPAGDFRLLVILFLTLNLVWIGAGCLRCGRTGGLRLPDFMNGSWPDPDAMVWWALFAALLLFQLYKAYTMASFDGDDAYYTAQSLQTWQTNTMYYYVPYTGITTTLDGRHALALMPMWIAYVARLCGTHPTIVTHSLLPLVLLPAVDALFYQLTVELTANQPARLRRHLFPAAMIILAVLQIFGNTSIYTPETFLLMRTWQGKSMFANYILPALFVLLLRELRSDKEDSAFCWCMLVILGIASGFCTSLAPALLTGLLLLACLLIRIVKKQKGILLAGAAACIPSILYLVLLLRMIYPSLVPFLKGGRLP